MNVKHQHHIAVVEDNPAQRATLDRMLGSGYRVSCFESGTIFLECPEQFDAVLLDIEMPGADGYETCRRLRSRPEGTDVPVLFVSAHDTVPDRVTAYKAGGDDFIIKPIAVHELRHKVRSIVEQRIRLRELAAQSSSAQQVAFTAMTSMADLGVIIEFLRQSANNTTFAGIVQQLIDAMAKWGLRGAVQVRTRIEHLNRTTEGKISPLQAAVLGNMQDIGRIFEFGSRAIINFEHVSLLVQNLPSGDPEKVGRLRDHLAALAESADIRLAGLEAMRERDLQKLGIQGTLDKLRNTLNGISTQQHRYRQTGQQQMLDHLGCLAHTLRSFGLFENQEKLINEMVRDCLDNVLDFFNEAGHYELQLAEVLARLELLAAADYRCAPPLPSIARTDMAVDAIVLPMNLH